MGYRRFYTIETDATPAIMKQMCEWFRGKHNGPFKAEFLLGEADEAMTWYEFEEEMVELSTQFPSVTFKIKIENQEEPGVEGGRAYQLKAGSETPR